jgi:hypothetical protein
MKPSPGSVLVWAAVTVVIAAVVAGLFVLGSPMEERARRLDHRRVADLQGIAAATDLYWTRHSQLPASLDDLTAEPGVRISTRDPVSSEGFGYQPVDSAHYELCATFEGESGEIARDPETDLWAHGPGRQCFQLEAKEITREEARRPQRDPQPRGAVRDAPGARSSSTTGSAPDPSSPEAGTASTLHPPPLMSCQVRRTYVTIPAAMRRANPTLKTHATMKS